jgi:hypothetical protein
MKSFKEYINITESVSEFTDNIVKTLTDAGKELNFDPKDLKKHRQFGSHHDLLKGNDDRTDIQFDDSYENLPSYDGPRTQYNFRINNLGKYDLGLKQHDPRVEVTIGHIPDGEEGSHNRKRHVAFRFGQMYSDHPTLDPLGKIRAAPHIFDGVMRAVTHYSIHNDIDPSQIKFVYDPTGNEEPKKTSSGKERTVSPIMQKERLYSHIRNTLMDLHSRITGKS